MPNPSEDPVAYIQEGILDPRDRHLPATRDGLRVIDDELKRVAYRESRLQEFRAEVVRRMKVREMNSVYGNLG